jgi:anaerobic selenocysteine-containing dehydrogenase/Fe-S-cluster-containing dehydrogenase component
MKGESFQGNQNPQEMQTAQGGSLVQISRRRFLQVLGASSAVGAAACASPVKQEILPYVKPDPEQIPGVAVWYSSTCTECSAGCGIRVRTREGRAVKVEGNPNSPVNQGSLCALGQSSLQSLYDPDRIRQPLKKVVGGKFEPVTWDEVYGKINEALTKATNKKLLLTGELNAAQADLADEWTKNLGFSHVVWDPMQQVSVAKAAEAVFGTYGVPTYNIEKAQVVINFGADFLETWSNPVGYARQWSNSRKSDRPLRLVHIEPRLSLTGANADTWLKSNPGSEVRVAVFLLGALLERGRGQGLPEDVRRGINSLTKGVTSASVSAETGIAKEQLLLMVDYLAKADSSLILAGGTATATTDPLPLLVAVNYLNAVLGNVGKTVNVAVMQKPRSNAAQLAASIEEMNANKVDVLFTYGTNPQFTFPASYGFGYAVGRVGIKGEGSGKGAGLVVALASHLDETAQLADYILPVHTSLEDWGYVRPAGEAISLIQPSMRPIFPTQSVGDVLMTVAANAEKPVAGADDSTFASFVKANFLKVTAAQVGADSEKYWMQSLEKGGFFPAVTGGGSKPAISASALSMSFAAPAAAAAGDELLLYPYPSVKTFDGRAANRPWLQELPDPITQAVWGAWAEIHPATAKKLHIAQGDAMILRTADGEVHVPAYITEHVHEGIVAVPLGQGHTAYGRYAQSTGQASAYALLSKGLAKGSDALALVGTKVAALRGLGSGNLVTVQDFSSQEGRELARTKIVTAGTAVAAGAAHAATAHAEGYANGHGEGHGHDHAAGHEGGHHEPKQMYVQREHPLYQWGLSIDLAACTGCSACVVACNAENNVPVVGKKIVAQGREMSWIRIERYYDLLKKEDGAEELKVSFLPMLCQHCQNAPCEPVCPVYATYHNEEGMNAMVYNRCVGTRYCSNNCSYKVRRFNWFQYEWPELLDWQVNPDVTKRTVGVMEKCTFCVQRIVEAKDVAKDLGRLVEDGEIKPACVQTCPTQAITFGNLKDPESQVSKKARDERAYKVLDHHLNTQPSVSYLEDIRHKA